MVPGLFRCLAFSGKVSRFVAIVTFPYMGWLVSLRVFFELGCISSALVSALSWPSLVWWCASPRQVHGDRDIV